jgi:hypothetical protein
MDTKWEEMSAVEKREARFATWVSAPGVQFQNPESEACYKAAIARFKDALLLAKTPDRVPIVLPGTFMPGHLYGVTPYEAMYDTDKLASAYKRFLLDYKPDYNVTPFLIGSGKIFDILDYKQYKWPGHGISEASGYQFVEGEYMLPEEYDALIDDPSDFWIRTWFPRIFGGLEPLKNLLAFTDLTEIGQVSVNMIPFGIPAVQGALKALMNAGNEAIAWFQKIMGFEMEARSLGFPSMFGGNTKAPYDILADTLRGTRGIMIDLYRQPKNILKAVERLAPLAVKEGVGRATRMGNPVIFIPLHKGADGFMSDEQFRKFYWPTLKAVIIGLSGEGCIPFLFCEGSYDTRLDYLQELPKSSCLWIFDRTDMAKAKQMLGDKLCIGGNVPSSLILTGTAEKVKSYCKNLIDVAGKGGGYIMSFGTGMDEGKAETIHAMVDFTKEYGKYR